MHELHKKTLKIKRNIVRLSYENHWRHIGSALSVADILTVLYFRVAKKNDRIIFSKGHAAMALYAVLLEMGKLKENEISQMCEHPVKDEKLGIWCSTGSLGHGLSLGLGMALGGIKTFVVMSDGELDEGSSWEAIKVASELNIKVTAVVDFNGFQAYRKIPYSADVLKKRFAAFGWEAKIINGHDCKSLIKNFKSVPDHPRVFIARTIKGSGVSFMENKLESHYTALDRNLYLQAMKDLG